MAHTHINASVGAEVQVDLGPLHLRGILGIPPEAIGLVVFVHGSGSGRLSPRNQQVSAALQRQRFATLLMDLLTADEEAEDIRTGRLRFDIELLADRVEGASRWLAGRPSTRALPLGYFGASTGAAAALVAAARLGQAVGAVVSRGGRVDLASGDIPRVTAPTLLIVGELDPAVIEWNRQVLPAMRAPHELVIVPGASHLFEEPGKLEEVSRLAIDWFSRRLGGD